MGTDAFLSFMATYMSSAISGSQGTIESTTDSTLSGHPAKTFVVSSGGQEITMVMTTVGTKMYMVMTSGAPGTTVYTDYFLSSFKLK
jgi:hypothetical protein